MLIRAREVGKGLTLADALAIDEVEPLSGPLDKSAFSECLGNPAVARALLPEHVVRGDSGWKPSGADDLDPARELTNEHRSVASIVAVAHGVEHDLPDGALIARGQVKDEQTLLEMLQVVAQFDETPDLIEREEKSLPELLPLGGRPRRLVRTVLEDNFGLADMAA